MNNLTDLMYPTRLLIASSLLSLPICAQTYLLSNGINYEIETSATIIDSTSDLEGEVTIPSSVTVRGTSYPVTAIADNAFDSSPSITSITIPDSVTSIGSNVFSRCTSLDAVSLPSTLTTIGEGAFYQCRALNSITIPEGVTTIGSQAFYQCYSLEDVTFPSTLHTIEDFAFYQCHSLDDVALPDLVTTLGNYIFFECRSLKSITLPSSLSSIGHHTFSSCHSLSSITLPSSITTLYDYCFYGCRSLSQIYFMGAEPSMPVFQNNRPQHFLAGGRDIMAVVTDEHLDSYGAEGDVWNEITLISATSFSGQSSVADPSLLEIAIVDDHAVITNCPTDLTGSLTVPSTYLGYPVTEVSDRAFAFCNHLTEIVFPPSIESVGEYAFFHCTHLEGVQFSAPLSYLGSSAFELCYALQQLTTRNLPSTLGSKTFKSCYQLNTLHLPPHTATIGEALFLSCHSLEEIRLSNLITSLPTQAFQDCYDLHSIVIPESITEIADYTFAGGYNLTGLYFDGSAPEVSTLTFTDIPSHSQAWVSSTEEYSYGTIGDLWNSFTLTSLDSVLYLNSAYAAGHTGSRSAPDADPERRGVSNGLAYALNLPLTGPLSSAQRAMLPASHLYSDSTHTLSLNLPSELPSDATISICSSSDLDEANWIEVARKEGTASWTGSAAIASGTSSNGYTPYLVTNHYSPNTNARGFMRVDVIIAQ